jgi:hypothetical protein
MAANHETSGSPRGVGQFLVPGHTHHTRTDLWSVLSSGVGEVGQKDRDPCSVGDLSWVEWSRTCVNELQTAAFDPWAKTARPDDQGTGRANTAAADERLVCRLQPLVIVSAIPDVTY